MTRAPALASVAAVLFAASAGAQQPPSAPPGMPPAAPPGMPPAAPPGMPPAAPAAPMPAPTPAPTQPAPGAAPMPAPGAAPMPGAAPPAAWPGYAPYGAPPQGYYPQPYYYPPPMTVLPPPTLPYTEGEPVPQGYQLKTRPVRSMVIAGAITFGSTYLVSALTSASLIAASSSNNAGFAPLFAPIAGPFVTIGTAHATGAGILWLVLDGLGQTAGATMLIYGLVAEEKYLQRTPVARLTHPEVLVGPGTTALRWKF
jgi:hypothetical protein